MVEFNHKIALINIRKEGAKSSHFTSVWVSVHINTEKAMAPHSSTLTWKIHGWRSPVGCNPWGREESDTVE